MPSVFIYKELIELASDNEYLYQYYDTKETKSIHSQLVEIYCSNLPEIYPNMLNISKAQIIF